MILYTTYFAKLSKLPSNIVPISICLWPPKGVQIQSFPHLAPTQSILQEYKRQPDERRYTDRYCKEVLTQMNPHRVLDALLKLSGGKDIALVCYEKSGSFCHRTIATKWLEPALRAIDSTMGGEWNS